MQHKNDKMYINAALLLIAAGALFRLFFSGQFLLVPDETNYWQWGRHLDWGYHDNAPMIGWTIRLATVFLGHTETAVRLPSVIAMTIASLYLFAAAKRWFTPRAAFYTALLTQGILEFYAGGLLATTDGLQAAGWAAAAYHVGRAYENHRWSQWLLGGLWFGFGFLSKYTMAVFLPGAYLFGLLSAPHRSRLTDIRPYAGLLVGVLMFLPVIAWNASHDWNSVRHVAHIGGADTSFQLHVKYLGEYLGGQAGLISPLIFILVLAAWHIVAWSREIRWHYRYLFWTSFPMFAMFAILSLHTRVYANWPGTAYLTATILVAALFFDQSKATETHPGLYRFGRRIGPWAVGLAYGLTALLLLHVWTPVLPLSKKTDRVAREVVGWDILGEKTSEILQEMPTPQNTFIFGLRYQIASELAFYMPGNPETVAINRWNRPNVYDYWWEDEKLIGMDAVGVTESPDDQHRLQEVFETVHHPVKLKIYRDAPFLKSEIREPARIFYIYRAENFKGGLRWRPPNPEDIRVSH